MARNSERAMLLLNRWQELKAMVTRGAPRRRPRRTDAVDTVRDAEYWRNQLVREISVKIAEVQNASFGQQRLEELNADINRALREKNAWEARIRQLGGPDYRLAGSSFFESGCISLRDGYKYFGACKELEHLQKIPDTSDLSASHSSQRPSRAQLSNTIMPTYHGYRDEESYPTMLGDESQRELELGAI